MSERTVILVPRRAGIPDRDMLWAWVRDWWQSQLPEFEIFEGNHDTGQFNRSCAVNRAAGLADWQREQPWDVAIIIDADVICDAARVRAGVAKAGESGRMVLPFNVRYDVNQAGTGKIMAGFNASWRPYVRHTYTDIVSCVNIVTRKLWGDVGGFDEGFVGWGFEDNAFTAACRTFSGGPELRITGDLWHLYHATAPEGKKGTETHRRNRARADLYLRAAGDKAATRALRNTSPPAFEHRPTGIPRILHRTVPALVNPVHERFWSQWGKLLVGWQLMTWRDPLPLAEWPESGAKWAACVHGAQKAGLIRLEALWRHGGVYVDSDVEPFRSLEPLLPLSAFAAWEDERVIPDAVIAAVPGHPAIRAALDLALTLIDKGPWESGPGVTTKIFPNRSDVLLLPPGTFYPVHYKDPEREKKMKDHKAAPWTFALHMYEHSWKGK